MRNMSLGIALYSLAKGLSVTGPIHSGRETVYSNGSLQIYNVTQKDTGFYTFLTINGQVGVASITTTYLHVYNSLLNCGRPPSSAQPTIESVPPRVAEGSSVLLLVHNLPENLLALFWYRGIVVFKNLEIARHVIARNLSILGPGHSGKETMYNNGSLLLQNVTGKDAGLYTLRTLSTDLKVEVLHVQVQVDSSPLTYECPPPSVQTTIESVPPFTAEGSNVLLVVHNLPKNLRVLFWYKGVIVSNNFEVARHIIATSSSVLGPAHSGRETVYNNGSLLLQNVTLNDSRFYTLWMLSTDLKTGLAHVQLLVDTSHSTCCKRLMIEPVPRNAAKGESVLLLVHNLPEDMRTFSWYKGVLSIQIFKMAEYKRAMNSITWGPAHSRREMVYTNGSLLLQDVTEEDAGLYTLETMNRDLKIEMTHVQLRVKTSPVACRQPPTITKFSIESVPSNAVEGENALLLVHNIPGNLRAFSWYKGVGVVKSHEIVWYIVPTNRSLLGPAHSGRETVYPNGSLLLYNVTQKDTGFYTLRTLNTQLETQERHGHIHIYKPVTQSFMRITDPTVTVENSVVFTCVSADTGISIRWLFNNRSLQLTERMTLSPTRSKGNGELSIAKAKADCDISRLKEQLKAATEALGEKSPEGTTVSGYDIMKSKSNPDFLKKDRSCVTRQLRNIRSKSVIEQVSWDN
ncbi:Carcinoembryonic antigen-related cell adhesion molecule 3 [Microtus ochrogaster]|uniref:Carcinoembryonic antigen-related cell adhesion molecule 3 n=1 Tax=Microtus ochrogaster TaxID=79684 RepID=A0A8J6G0W9_MICOH|nr:Carcinoembryonic antigen-related cell adhesion molecule 3 [Microtus ochrogaster]